MIQGDNFVIVDIENTNLPVVQEPIYLPVPYENQRK